MTFHAQADRPQWFDQFPGLRERHTARQTDTVVSLYDGIAAGMDVTDGRWQTVCEEHGCAKGHVTLTLARYRMSKPVSWCEQCRDRSRSGLTIR